MKLRFTRIRYKLALAFLLQVFCIVSLVIALSYFSSVSIIRDKSIALNDKLMINGISSIESEFTNIKQIVYSLFRNEDFVKSIPHSNLKDDEAFFDTYNLIGVSMQDVLAARSDIYSIIYLDNDNNLIYCTRTNYSYERAVKPEEMPEWLQDTINRLKNKNTGYILIPTHTHYPSKSDFVEMKEQVYTYACPALDVNKGYRSIGILLINFNLSKLQEIAENVNPYNDSFTYIIDGNGNIVFDSTQTNTGASFQPDMLDKVKTTKEYFAAKIEDKNYVIVHAGSTLTNWNILSFVPEAEYSKDINNITKYIVITAIFAIILSIFLTFLISKQFSAPIENLSKIMNKIEDGDIDLRVEESGEDEIGTLRRSFNSLISRLQYVMKNEYELAIRQKDAELKALQAQINPHFLFNVLQSINSIAVLHNIGEISTMAMSLGKIMRYSIKTDDNVVRIKDECECIQHFLDIQKVRYGDKIEFHVDIQKELMEYSVLKLTIQPVVENSVIHGFKNDETKWILLIHAFLQDGFVTFDISDNGIGMTEKKLIKLTEELERSQTGFYTNDSPSIGLKNVYYRLKIFYGNDAEMKIDSERGVGTTVRIRFPAILGK